jgi:hypothetical protein
MPPQLGPRLFNPFVNATPDPGVMEWIKIILIFPTLGLVRLVLIVLVLVLVALLCSLAAIGAPSKPSPTSARSRFVFGVAAVGARMILFLIGFYWISVKGKKAPSKVCIGIVCCCSQFLLSLFSTSCKTSLHAHARLFFSKAILCDWRDFSSSLNSVLREPFDASVTS